MMDLMSLFNDFMAMIIIILVTRPFFLCKFAFIFCLKATIIVFQTWMELIKAATGFHVNMIRRTMISIAALVSLPVRVLTALQRERLLEQHLHRMHVELETLVWDRKELEDHLQKAIKERRIVESMLAELEDEHDKAIAKIELLEAELQDLKDETFQLKEISGKGCWSVKGHDDTGNGKSVGVADNYNIPYGFPPWKSGLKGSDTMFQDLMINRDAWEGENKSNAELFNFLKSGFAATGPVHPIKPGNIPRNLEMNDVLDKRRGVALSQSLFSAVLSLLVGMIIWEAEDPCMPLVVALFTVVGMSLKSVVQFFSTIKNKPASDAVALLSFNWFILGTLTYPTLPKVARMLAPLVRSVVDKTMSW